MGPRSVGDPGLVSSDGIVFTIFHGTGPQGAKIRAGVGFGEHGSGQGFSAGNPWQPFGFLFVRTASDDQLSRDFRAGGERSDTDIATRKFF